MPKVTEVMAGAMGLKFTLSDKEVTEPKLDDNSVSERTIQNQAVGGDKIKAGAVNSAHIQTNAVQGNHIAPATIDASKFVAGVLTNETANGLQIVEINEQLSDIAYQVTKYGAKGNGTNDDTDAIQSAIDAAYAAGGGTVLVPKGNYRIRGDVIRLKNKVRLMGVGMPRIFTNSGVGYATMIGCDYNGALNDIVVEGIFFDQWDEIGKGIPNLGVAPQQMQAVVIYGASKDCFVRDCKIQGLGSWCICIMDSDISHGGSGAVIENNRIYWKQARNQWYDASAIYVDNFNHRISNNYIETINTGLHERWRIEGGIETHGIGNVDGNTIINVQAGINVCPHTYHTPKEQMTRYIVRNNIINCDRGMWFWNYKFDNLADVGNKNVVISHNRIKVVRDGYYRGVGAIDSQMVQSETGHVFLGGMSHITIDHNEATFETLSAYTGSAFMDILNSGAFHIVSNVAMSHIKVTNNKIIGFPYPSIVTYVYNTGQDVLSRNLQVMQNHIEDCGYEMGVASQKNVFCITRINDVDIKNNSIKWKNKNGVTYLLNVLNVTGMWFEGNTQYSENGFTIYTINADATFLNDTKNVVFAKAGQTYYTNAGSPAGVVTPKFIGQEIFDSNNNKWYKAYGLTNATWQPIMLPQSGPGDATSTPAYVGQTYVNTVTKKVYVSTGTASSADWTLVN